MSTTVGIESKKPMSATNDIKSKDGVDREALLKIGRQRWPGWSEEDLFVFCELCDWRESEVLKKPSTLPKFVHQKLPSVGHLFNVYKAMQLDPDAETVRYRGKVKLHGRQMAILLQHQWIAVQSHHHILTDGSGGGGGGVGGKVRPGTDRNSFVNGQEAHWLAVGDAADYKNHMVIYGEYCGSNIQKAPKTDSKMTPRRPLALELVKETQFTIFAIKVDAAIYYEPSQLLAMITLNGAVPLPPRVHVIPWHTPEFTLHIYNEVLVKQIASREAMSAVVSESLPSDETVPDETVSDETVPGNLSLVASERIMVAAAAAVGDEKEEKKEKKTEEPMHNHQERKDMRDSVGPDKNERLQKMISSADQEVVDYINSQTEAIDLQDPWVLANFGQSGVGEGLVFYRMTPTSTISCTSFGLYGFKSKGKSHAVVQSDKASQVEVPVVAGVEEFATRVLTESRLQQGFLASGSGKRHKSLQDFAAWIKKDIIKECTIIMEASGLIEKDVVKMSIQKTIAWFKITLAQTHVH
jgi:hypothetical protein